MEDMSKGWFPSLGIGHGINYLFLSETVAHKIFHIILDLTDSLAWIRKESIDRFL
jgi:hypothetical protein